jgi:hypothetical protein
MLNIKGNKLFSSGVFVILDEILEDLPEPLKQLIGKWEAKRE